MSERLQESSGPRVERQGMRWGLVSEETWPSGEYNLTEAMMFPQGVLVRTTVGFNGAPSAVSLAWMEGVTDGNFKLGKPLGI